jgi:hypothetical protein
MCNVINNLVESYKIKNSKKANQNLLMCKKRIFYKYKWEETTWRRKKSSINT